MKKYLGKVASVTEASRSASFLELPALPYDRTCREMGAGFPLTVISANLCHDWPRHRRLEERLESFVSLARQSDADLILLQEVARLRHIQIDQWLAGQLGMAYVYSRVNGHPQVGFEEGLAVFSRFPIQQLHFKQFDSQRNPFVRRLALGVRVETPCGKLNAISTHLSLFNRQNAAQVKHLSEWLSEIWSGDPTIIGGDFNAHEKSRQIRQLSLAWQDTFRHFSPSGDGTTHSFSGPRGLRFHRRRLDYIFFHPGLSGWRVLDSRHILEPGKPHSDHHLVVSRIGVLAGA